MTNPLATQMTWEDYQTMVTSLLGGNMQIDPTLFTQLLNDSRVAIEQDRDWQVLTAFDQTLTWTPSDTYQTGKTMPARFVRWIEDNPIQLWDGKIQNPTILPVSVIPYREVFWNYSSQYTAAVDFTSMLLYFMGNSGQIWTVLLSYIQDNGDIVSKTLNNNVATTWGGFPARFDKVLAYDVAARIRLGVSYDDLAARNADENGKQAMAILAAMRKWDGNLQKSWIRNRDLFAMGEPSFTNHKIQNYPNP